MVPGGALPPPPLQLGERAAKLLTLVVFVAAALLVRALICRE
jgi:hypothetical protein